MHGRPPEPARLRHKVIDPDGVGQSQITPDPGDSLRVVVFRAVVFDHAPGRVVDLVILEALRRIRKLLTDVLRNEMRLGNLARNVAELSVMPAEKATTNGAAAPEDGDLIDSVRRSLDHDELRRLWQVARQPLLVVVDLCGRNGLRPSEARALRWDCVDTESLTITIDRQLSNSDHLTQTKTRKARRTIEVDDVSISSLEAWRSIQEVRRARAGPQMVGWGPAFVITTRYGTPINRNNLARMVTAACEDAAVSRIVPYELRHTAISHQRDAKRDSGEVADWAGTSERMVNEIYRYRLRETTEIRPVSIDGLDVMDSGPDPGPTCDDVE